VQHVTLIAAAKVALAAEAFALAIFDVGLPDGTGFELCKELRRTSDLPVLFLTARSDEIDKVVGLEIGGDDYVAKPFSPREVVARIRAVLKRVQSPARTGGGEVAPAQLAPGLRAMANAAHTARAPYPISHDAERARIYVGDQWTELTKAEYLILAGFLRKPGRVFSRAEILAFVSPEQSSTMERTVDVHMKSLRAKLRAADQAGALGGDAFETHRGLGYSLREYV
jgi:two-component system, OmpR family, catabolic regulation response regulator CreB